MSDSVYVVDRRQELPWRGSYVISCQCMNCGLFHVALFSKGQPAKRETALCPFCDCLAVLVYRSTEEAIKGIGTRPLRLMQETADGYKFLREPFTLQPAQRPDPELRLIAASGGAKVYPA